MNYNIILILLIICIIYRPKLEGFVSKAYQQTIGCGGASGPRYTYRTKSSALEACKKAGYESLCHSSTIVKSPKAGNACCTAWTDDGHVGWYQRNWRSGCGGPNRWHSWLPRSGAGAHCCGLGPILGLYNSPERTRSYSSVYSNDPVGSGHARSELDSAQAWVAAHLNLNQYMQIDLKKITLVDGIVTQGRHNNNQWVTSYKISMGKTLSDMTLLNKGSIFSGNTDRDSKVMHRFKSSIQARYIRIIPVSWNTYISMRAGVILNKVSPLLKNTWKVIQGSVNFKDGSIDNNGTAELKRGAIIEWPHDLKAPIDISADVKTTRRGGECIGMLLFGTDSNNSILYQSGAWGNKVRLFPGDFKRYVGRNDKWTRIRVTVTRQGTVSFYHGNNKNPVYITNFNKTQGRLRFYAQCVDMQVRDVNIKRLSEDDVNISVKGCVFSKPIQNTYLSGCATNCSGYATLNDATKACVSENKCKGITKNRNKYQLRKGGIAKPSPSGETSWLIQNAWDCASSRINEAKKKRKESENIRIANEKKLQLELLEKQKKKEQQQAKLANQKRLKDIENARREVARIAKIAADKASSTLKASEKKRLELENKIAAERVKTASLIRKHTQNKDRLNQLISESRDDVQHLKNLQYTSNSNIFNHPL